MAKVSINQALRHLSYRSTQGHIGEFGLTHPPVKVSRFKNSMSIYYAT
jgi:hypothetical protein